MRITPTMIYIAGTLTISCSRLLTHGFAQALAIAGVMLVFLAVIRGFTDIE